MTRDEGVLVSGHLVIITIIYLLSFVFRLILDKYPATQKILFAILLHLAVC